MYRFTLLAAFLFLSLAAGRAQWALQTSNTTADLRGIHSIGNGVAWASGTNGTVLRTEDGGYVWQACSVPPGAEKLDFRGIQGFDANTAIVMSSGKGDLSRLYKTTDGCHSWKLVFTNPDPEGFWDALRASASQLTILGDPVNGSFVYETSGNGGKNWKRESLPISLPGESAFAASNSALFEQWNDGITLFGSGGSEGARVFTSCEPCEKKPFDVGSWHVQQLPFFGQGTSSGVFSIFADVNGASVTYVAVGGDYSNPEREGKAAYSLKWLKWMPSQTPPHGYRSSVEFDAPSKTWITVGPNGTDISTDDGRNWRPVRPDAVRHEAPDADRNWNAISLPFVVGPHGRIGKLNSAALKR